MKKLMSSTAAKIIGYVLLVISGILSVVSGIGIYSAMVLRFYNMEYYMSDFSMNNASDYDIFMKT